MIMNVLDPAACKSKSGLLIIVTDRSSGAEIMSDFIHRPKPLKRFRIYSSTDSETDMENVEPNIMSQKEIQIYVSSGEDDIPLAEISSKTRFKTFLPTPDYGVVKTCTRKKAINYKGQRITKNLFCCKEIQKKIKPKEIKISKKKASTNVKDRSETNNDSVERVIKDTKETQKKKKITKKKKSTSAKDRSETNKDSEEKVTKDTKEIQKKTKPKKEESTTNSWFCHACNEDRVADMRTCTDCSRWFHEVCVGLTQDDTEPFLCPDCDKN
ncbi:hypothetical protein O0L34_g14598 [Tuta absoluta]|nr:hypothetical protein O0L34_g14598 [Tuta absoluta]